MNVRYRVELSQEERAELEALLSGGKHAARKLKRAQILLAADAGANDREIARGIGVSGSTVSRTKQRFVLGNLAAALSEEPRPGAQRKLSGKEEALLVATACSKPPTGRARWTLELLAGEMVKLTEHGELSRETVRRRLAENDLKPWRRDMWCIPEVDGTYVARMEDVLDLYAETPDPKRPVVCFDESPTQLIGEVRQPIPATPGQLERYDCEYRRNGTANLFVFLDAHRPWRTVKVTDRRTARDFADCMRDLVDLHYPRAELIRVVLDNLSTHSPGALYEAFPPRHTASCAAWSSTTPQSMLPGSTWSRSRLASCAANASTAASKTAIHSRPRSTLGSVSETPTVPASNGCSPLSALASNCCEHIQTRPKSHNHCAQVLGRHFAFVPLPGLQSILSGWRAEGHHSDSSAFLQAVADGCS
jgi:transposase